MTSARSPQQFLGEYTKCLYNAFRLSERETAVAERDDGTATGARGRSRVRRTETEGSTRATEEPPVRANYFEATLSGLASC